MNRTLSKGAKLSMVPPNFLFKEVQINAIPAEFESLSWFSTPKVSLWIQHAKINRKAQSRPLLY